MPFRDRVRENSARLTRAAAALTAEDVDSVWKGFAFEDLLHHELRAYASIARKDRPIFHYSVSGGFDADFLVQVKPKTLSASRQFVAVEAKLGRKFKSQWTKGISTLVAECGNQVRRGIVVYQGTDRLLKDGIEIMPVTTFLEELHAGRVV